MIVGDNRTSDYDKGEATVTEEEKVAPVKDVCQFKKAAAQEAYDSTTLPPMDTPEEAIPRSLVPWARDDDRSRYLGLRASGFTIRETLGLLGKAKSTLSLWRQNSEFNKLEATVPELRKTLALEYAGLEYLRNYRLVLEKDFRVVKGSLTRERVLGEDGKWHTTPQDSQDYQYLLRMRQHYTPQMLQSIEAVFGKGGNSKEFNWTDFVVTMSRTQVKEEVKVETRHRQESNLAPLEIDSELTDA